MFLICLSIGTEGVCGVTAGLPDAGPTGKARVKANTAQLVAAADSHESRWCGKPLFMVGWKGNVRRATCQVPSTSCLWSRKRSPPRATRQRSGMRDAGVAGEHDDGLDALLADPLGRDQLGEVPGGVIRVDRVQIGEPVAVRGIGGRGEGGSEQGEAAPARCRFRLRSFLPLELVGLLFGRFLNGVE